MKKGRLMFELIFLLLETELTSGLSVSYSILTPNCGAVGRVESLTHSIALRPYGMKIENKTAFVFDVKANRDVGIYVTDIPNSATANNAYRFVIGSYNNAMIQLQVLSNGQESQKVITSGTYLNAGIFKPFWCSWENGEIQAGQGDIIGQNTMMSWTDPNPFRVDGIGINTCYGGTGEWKINVEVEDNFTGHFSKCQRSNTTSRLPTIASYVASELSCAISCETEKTCIGFNYQPTNKRCELLSFGDEPVTDIMRRDLDGWDFYTKCYDGNTVCVGCFF